MMWGRSPGFLPRLSPSVSDAGHRRVFPRDVGPHDGCRRAAGDEDRAASRVEQAGVGILHRANPPQVDEPGSESSDR